MEVSRAAAPADPSPQKRECTRLDTAGSTAPELAPRTRGCTGQEASWQGPGRVAPRARGCARAVQVEENHAAVSPARAGMHRHKWRANPPVAHIPRPGGDGPVLSGYTALGEEAAPRTRGSTAAARDIATPGSGDPADAGMTTA